MSICACALDVNIRMHDFISACAGNATVPSWFY
jgi:hypothetical protein